MAVTPVVPRVAMAQQGMYPLAISRSIALSRASGSIEKSLLTSTLTRLSRPNPAIPAPFSTDEWVWPETYMRIRPVSESPSLLER
ncbi:MAG: hypothetical protein BWY89_00653 [Bacteroidetes bacterium ADurb.BinA012]|nr:MAG: hypothetical protein BWY89_00653 [Bacteroidetes bacterium ADurb.BinA012]